MWMSYDKAAAEGEHSRSGWMRRVRNGTVPRCRDEHGEERVWVETERSGLDSLWSAMAPQGRSESEMLRRKSALKEGQPEEQAKWDDLLGKLRAELESLKRFCESQSPSE